jgi:hypothetical protein
MLDVHPVPAFGKSQLRDLTREDLQGFLSRKLNSGLSWETVHHFKCGLSKILGAAEEWGCVTENVAVKTKLPRRQYGMERAVLTPVQVRNLGPMESLAQTPEACREETWASWCHLASSEA